MSTQQPKTIEELVQETYADDSLETRFGRRIWELINTDRSNVLSLFDKLPWVRDGFRVITDFDKPVRPENYRPKIKAVTGVTAQEVSREYHLETTGVPFPTEESRYEFVAKTFASELHKIFFKNRSHIEPTSLEELLIATTEINNCPGVYPERVYGLQRQEHQWMDSYVNHNAGSLRKLSLEFLDAMIRETKKNTILNGKQFFITGYDTFEFIEMLLVERRRKKDEVMTYNPEGPLYIETHNGVPIFPFADVPKDDGEKTLSRLYLITPQHLFLKFAQLPRIQRLADRLVVSTKYEVIANKFNCHAKLRDLSTDLPEGVDTKAFLYASP